VFRYGEDALFVLLEGMTGKFPLRITVVQLVADLDGEGRRSRAEPAGTYPRRPLLRGPQPLRRVAPLPYDRQVASGPVERARLLGLTCEFILTRGVVDLSLSELSRGIGSNNRMLLYHFGSLDALISGAVDEILGGTTLIDRLRALLATPGTPAERVTAAWHHIAAPARLPHLHLFFARFGMAADVPGRHPEFLAQTRDRWVALVADALRDDPAVTRPQETATAVVALWRGLQMALICGAEPATVEAAHAQAVSALLPGGVSSAQK
jgi:AcrR family transcriptional regulator